MITDHNQRLAPLQLSGSPICLTEFGVKTTGTERKGGGIHFGKLSLLQHQILVSQVEATHLQSCAFIWGMNETCVQHTHIWWYNQSRTMVGADLSVFSWEELLPANDSDEYTHILPDFQLDKKKHAIWNENEILFSNELAALHLNGWLAFTRAFCSVLSEFLWNPR